MKKKNSTACSYSDDPVPVHHQLTEMFWTLGPAFTRWAESHMHEKGLSPQRVRLMWQLLENGPMMMSALRDESGVTATNITALVDALQKDGMVKRKPHATDRRATLISITPKAEKMLTQNCGEFKEKVAAIFSCMSAQEQEHLLKLLLKMRGELIRRHVLEDCDFCHSTKEKAS